jgi:hypothetical protein
VTGTNHVGNGVNNIRTEREPSNGASITPTAPKRLLYNMMNRDEDDEEVLSRTSVKRETTADLYDATPRPENRRERQTRSPTFSEPQAGTQSSSTVEIERERARTQIDGFIPLLPQIRSPSL